jgi:hypothetical protein
VQYKEDGEVYLCIRDAANLRDEKTECQRSQNSHVVNQAKGYPGPAVYATRLREDREGGDEHPTTAIPEASRSKDGVCGHRLLVFRVRIPLEAWMFVSSKCCVLSGRGLCDRPITRPGESYTLRCIIECDLETSRIRRHWPALGCCARVEKKNTQRKKRDNFRPSLLQKGTA